MIKDKKVEFELINFGEYYYPTPKLKENLKKLIIFTENIKKRDIPSGSVFVYENKKYNPEILNSDVGCGISAFITEKISFDESDRKDILKAVDEVNVHIGQGNHFLDFTTAHPSLRKKGIESNMIYLHSDFNNKNIIPEDYESAKNLENEAKNKRLDYVDKLSRVMKVNSKFYNDWTHNSVNVENDLMVYRKGAINLNETDGVGVLALNPVEGLLLYGANFNNYLNSMQHGLGRIGSKSNLGISFKKESWGIARGYTLQNSKEVASDVFNSIDSYITNFSKEQELIGVCVPEFVITTKKSSNR
jgi:hypothetical protein